MKIRTRMRPDIELDVGPRELEDLTRWGLVIDTPPVPSPDETPAPADPSSAPTTEPEPSTEETTSNG